MIFCKNFLAYLEIFFILRSPRTTRNNRSSTITIPQSESKKFSILCTFKSRATTVYFRLGKLRRVYTYVQHMWGIIGHVMVEAGNTVGTDGAPPQVPPKLCGGRLRG